MKKLLTLLLLSGFMLTNTISAKSEEQTETVEISKTDEVLAKAVEKAINLAEKTGDFAIEQAPLLLKEFYQWHIFSDIFWIVFAIILFLIGRYAPNYWTEQGNSTEYGKFNFFHRNGDDEYAPPTWILFTICLILSIVLLLVDLYDLLYILVAPKLYLIDYFIK